MIIIVSRIFQNNFFLNDILNIHYTTRQFARNNGGSRSRYYFLTARNTFASPQSFESHLRNIRKLPVRCVL